MVSVSVINGGCSGKERSVIVAFGDAVAVTVAVADEELVAVAVDDVVLVDLEACLLLLLWEGGERVPLALLLIKRLTHENFFLGTVAGYILVSMVGCKEEQLFNQTPTW